MKPLTMSGQISVNDAPVSIAFPKGSGLEEAVQAALNSPDQRWLLPEDPRPLVDWFRRGKRVQT